MLTSTNAFMDALERWLKAARAGDFETARAQAEDLILTGELLAIHPDFIQAFKEHSHNGLEPKQALFHLSEFLVCATDGRAKVLKQWAIDNKP